MDDKSEKPISISNDPWETYNDIEDYGQLTLSNIEFTTSTLCNMRCSHCAVGYTLQTKRSGCITYGYYLSSFR